MYKRQQYDLDRWYDELRMKIIDAYTTAVEQLSILRSAAEAKITSEAQYRMTEVDFVKGKLDAQTLSRQKSLENSATREYEQVRRNLNDALLRLETDAAFRARQVAYGLERVKRFSWEKTARHLLALYESLGKTN